MSNEPDADLDARWYGIEHFPEAWKNRLDARFHSERHSAATTAPALPAGKNAAETLLDTLLNLEVACSIESPEEFHPARQRLKILALKNAMEGRQTTATTPGDIERWLLNAASYPRPDATSKERLAKIIASVRNRRLV